MTATCFTAPGEGETVQRLMDAAPSLPVAGLLARRVLDARPGCRWVDLLAMRTNVKLLNERWTSDDFARFDKIEVTA